MFDRPVFEVTFDSIKRKCVYQKMKFHPQKLSIVKAQLKNAGYNYDEVNDIWINAQKKVMWKITMETYVSNSGTEYNRYIECFPYKKIANAKQ